MREWSTIPNLGVGLIVRGSPTLMRLGQYVALSLTSNDGCTFNGTGKRSITAPLSRVNTRSCTYLTLLCADVGTIRRECMMTFVVALACVSIVVTFIMAFEDAS
jgi:hypothetical protein